MKIICLKGLEIQQNVMWLFFDNTYFLNCFLSLFSSHLFRKSSSRCYIFHLSSPRQVAFLKRTIKKYGKTDWICIFFLFWWVMRLVLVIFMIRLHSCAFWLLPIIKIEIFATYYSILLLEICLLRGLPAAPSFYLLCNVKSIDINKTTEDGMTLLMLTYAYVLAKSVKFL